MEISTQNTKFSELEYLAAEAVLKDFSLGHFTDLGYSSSPVKGQSFDADFLGSRVRKPNFINCSFEGTQFDGNDATASILMECDFNRVIFRDVCLNYSNLASSKFHAVLFDNCGCSNCDFSSVRMLNSKVTGCDFIHSFFYEADISTVTFIHCSFEEAEFKNTQFINVDLSQAGLDYAILDTVSFSHTTLPFWGVLRSFGGLNALHQSTDTYIKYSSDSRKVSALELLSKLETLQAYFYRKKLFFELANVYIFLGKQKDALACILEGLGKSIQNRDFRGIRHLCELASKNQFFTKQQLHQLYDLLISQDAISDMNHHEYQLYQTEIRGINHLLVENPYGLPRMTILIQTAFSPDDYTSLAMLLRFIDQAIIYYLPQCVYHLSIYRNSPPQIEISICESLFPLILFLSTLAATVFGAGNKSVSFLKEVCLTNGIRLDNREKKAHLKAAKEQDALKTEHMRLENELLRLQISKQELELEKYRQEIEQEDPTPSKQNAPELSADVKQQIPTIKFFVQTDDPVFIALRQGVLSSDSQLEPLAKLET